MLYPLELTHRAMTDNCLISKSVCLSDSLDQQNSLHGIYQPTRSKMFLKLRNYHRKNEKKIKKSCSQMFFPTTKKNKQKEIV